MKRIELLSFCCRLPSAETVHNANARRSAHASHGVALAELPRQRGDRVGHFFRLRRLPN